jgi:hypothetical protein
MRLATRLRKIEAKVLREDDVLRLLCVFEEVDGTWHDGRGTTIDSAVINPRTQVIVFRERPDGPQ